MSKLQDVLFKMAKMLEVLVQERSHQHPSSPLNNSLIDLVDGLYENMLNIPDSRDDLTFDEYVRWFKENNPKLTSDRYVTKYGDSWIPDVLKYEYDYHQIIRSPNFVKPQFKRRMLVLQYKHKTTPYQYIDFLTSAKPTFTPDDWKGQGATIDCDFVNRQWCANWFNKDNDRTFNERMDVKTYPENVLGADNKVVKQPMVIQLTNSGNVAYKATEVAVFIGRDSSVVFIDDFTPDGPLGDFKESGYKAGYYLIGAVKSSTEWFDELLYSSQETPFYDGAIADMTTVDFANEYLKDKFLPAVNEEERMFFKKFNAVGNVSRNIREYGID